ncbi:MAG: tyrosine-type recombinase/integrase, partial [Candidatus Hodarchaeota archaeon]
TTSFRDCCLLKSLFWAGLRREEATKLDIRDIDFDRKRIKVRGKGNKFRTVPIIDVELFNELKYLVSGIAEGLVFANSNSKSLLLWVRMALYQSMKCNKRIKRNYRSERKHKMIMDYSHWLSGLEKIELKHLIIEFAMSPLVSLMNR